MILLIDNYDSFTWNVYQYFCELGAEVLVRRNDELTLEEIAALLPEKIVISPGPCTPNESGISAGGDCPLCRSDSAAGRLSWPSGYRPGLWGHYRESGESDARPRLPPSIITGRGSFRG